MTGSILEHLVPSCEQVLETMFFTGVMSSEERTPGVCAGGICGTVTFTGPPDGILAVGLSRETASALASSFLGLPLEEVTDSDLLQIAGELANMFCGSLLSRCAPSSELHLATHASVCPVERGCGCPLKVDTSVFLELPEGTAQVSIRVDRI